MSKKLEKNPIKLEDTITINGTEYKLQFDFAVAVAVENELDKALIMGFDRENLFKPQTTFVAALLYALLKASQPDITYEKALKLLNARNQRKVWEIVVNLWGAAQAEPEPIEEGQEKN